MNPSLKCKDCTFFDEQYKVVRGKKIPLWYGWCAKKSVYPAKEEEGQVFHPEASKAESHTELAKPYIVVRDGVEQGCVEGIRK